MCIVAHRVNSIFAHQTACYPGSAEGGSEMPKSDDRTAREMIADALIPPEAFLLRAAYLLGKDDVLLYFLPTSRSGESPAPSPTSEVPEGNYIFKSRAVIPLCLRYFFGSTVERVASSSFRQSWMSAGRIPINATIWPLGMRAANRRANSVSDVVPDQSQFTAIFSSRKTATSDAAADQRWSFVFAPPLQISMPSGTKNGSTPVSFSEIIEGAHRAFRNPSTRSLANVCASKSGTVWISTTVPAKVCIFDRSRDQASNFESDGPPRKYGPLAPRNRLGVIIRSRSRLSALRRAASFSKVAALSLAFAVSSANAASYKELSNRNLVSDLDARKVTISSANMNIATTEPPKISKNLSLSQCSQWSFQRSGHCSIASPMMTATDAPISHGANESNQASSAAMALAKAEKSIGRFEDTKWLGLAAIAGVAALLRIMVLVIAFVRR